MIVMYHTLIKNQTVLTRLLNHQKRMQELNIHIFVKPTYILYVPGHDMNSFTVINMQSKSIKAT